MQRKPQNLANSQKQKPSGSAKFSSNQHTMSSKDLFTRHTQRYQKSENSEKNQTNGQTSLLNCKSLANISATNGFIKMNSINSKTISQLISKIQKSPDMSKFQQRRPSQDRFNNSISGRRTMDAMKKPKFTRKKTINVFETEAVSAFQVKPVNVSTNHNEITNQNLNLKRKNERLQKQIQDLTIKIKRFQSNLYPEKIQSLQKQLSQTQALIKLKDQQISQLKQRLKNIQQQNRNLGKKSQRSNTQGQPYKTIQSSISQNIQQLNHIKLEQDLNNLNTSIIGLDMLSTAQYIQNLSDLQQQLHLKNTEIFTLNKAIEQMKIKLHSIELRNQENIKRNNQQWENKYKRLLNMYRNVKASKLELEYEGVKMPKLNIKGNYECTSKDMDDYFNLSLSTDRSHVPVNGL